MFRKLLFQRNSNIEASVVCRKCMFDKIINCLGD